MNRTRIALGDTFDIFIDESGWCDPGASSLLSTKVYTAAILECILQEKIFHVDETSVKLIGLRGYVWVLAGMDKAYYFYKPSREGSFLQEMFRSFSGVLISDFYTAYDSLNCVQQKCLIHLCATSTTIY